MQKTAFTMSQDIHTQKLKNVKVIVKSMVKCAICTLQLPEKACNWFSILPWNKVENKGNLATVFKRLIQVLTL